METIKPEQPQLLLPDNCRLAPAVDLYIGSTAWIMHEVNAAKHCKGPSSVLAIIEFVSSAQIPCGVLLIFSHRLWKDCWQVSDHVHVEKDT